MGLYKFKQLPDDLNEVDIIIAGGGTAGCIVASRLADADRTLTILVIEGGSNNDLPSVMVPAFFMQNLLPETKTNLFYQANPEKQLADRGVIVPSGGVLGGGSSTNLMMYSRAQRSDFDSWGVKGWSADEMIPYMKKLETYHGQVDSNGTHGHDGPIHVSTGTFTSSRLQDHFIAAANQLGWPELEDLQNLQSCNGVQRALRYISQDGKRQDTASRYLHPRLQDSAHYPNLHVVVESQVVRVLIEDGRAVGVEFRQNPLHQEPDEQAPPPRTRVVKARKTVVVSCGALGTPLVLERSGLGDRTVLQRAGIPLVAHLPGVGSEYEDHLLNLYPYRSSLNPDETADSIAQGRVDPMALVQTNDKILGWNTMDVTCKLRPTDADISKFSEEFQRVWESEFAKSPDRPLGMMAPVAVFPGDPSTVPAGQYFTISTFSVYPFSRGHIHITGPDPSNDPLDFETGFLSDRHGLDLQTQIWLYKTQREIARRMPCYRGEIAAGHPPFAPGSKAAVAIEFATTTTTPLENSDNEKTLEGGGIVTNIQYSVEDDKVIEQWVRENVETTWHSLGTCKMGASPEEEVNSVVDADLNVHKVRGLKIADLSVVPRNVVANTNNTAMVIGEKAAEIILRELAQTGL